MLCLERAMLVGKSSLADEFERKAAVNHDSILANCWNDEPWTRMKKWRIWIVCIGKSGKTCRRYLEIVARKVV